MHVPGDVSHGGVEHVGDQRRGLDLNVGEGVSLEREEAGQVGVLVSLVPHPEIYIEKK